MFPMIGQKVESKHLNLPLDSLSYQNFLIAATGTVIINVLEVSMKESK